jgi:hypothetical protein
MKNKNSLEIQGYLGRAEESIEKESSWSENPSSTQLKIMSSQRIDTHISSNQTNATFGGLFL